jgi:hypothetical protein
LSVIVADHRRWHRRKQKCLFLATIADHRRLPPAWKIYEKWVKVVFSSTSKEIINWSFTEIMNFTLGHFVPWWEISKHIGCNLRRLQMYENFRAFASASIGDKRRRSSVTVCDEWELGLTKRTAKQVITYQFISNSLLIYE